jgi:hypothetical protein
MIRVLTCTSGCTVGAGTTRPLVEQPLLSTTSRQSANDIFHIDSLLYGPRSRLRGRRVRLCIGIAHLGGFGLRLRDDGLGFSNLLPG